MNTKTPVELLEAELREIKNYQSRGKRNCGVILNAKGMKEFDDLISLYEKAIKILSECSSVAEVKEKSFCHYNKIGAPKCEFQCVYCADMKVK